MDQMPIREMTDAQLASAYTDVLTHYREWVNKDIPLNGDWTEEIEYMCYLRSEIHSMTEEMKARSSAIDTGRLREIDQEWQSWALRSNPRTPVLEHERSDTPKSQWWEWIDQIQTLTEEERSTL